MYMFISVTLGLDSFQPFLGPCPLDSKWTLDTRFITPEVLARIVPTGMTDSMTTCSYHSVADLKAAQASNPADEIISFTNISLKHSARDNPDVTTYSLDKSLLLKSLLDSDTQVLGEFQLAFVLFSVAGLYDGFEQWKMLLHVVLGCDECIPQHQGFFIAFMGLRWLCILRPRCAA